MKPILALQQVPHEGMGTLEDAIRDSGLDYRYVELFAGPTPEVRIEKLAGLVVLGGPMNVDETDRFPFLEREVEWIRQAIDRRVPVLGICLGSQLLAKALGAKVYPNRVKEIGWYEIEMLPASRDDLLFASFAGRETVFQWHGDTFDLPPGAVHLASSPACRHQAFRHVQSAWGLQFHLEMTAESIDAWFTADCNCVELATLDYIDPAAIRAATPGYIRQLNTLARRAFSEFANLCADRAAL